MKKNILITAVLSLLIFSPLVPLRVVHAGIVPSCGVLTTVPVMGTNGKQKVDSATKQPVTETKMENPCDFNDLMILIKNIMNFLLFDLALPLVAILICYAGFLLLSSGGSSEARTKAKKIIKNMIIGYIIALAAWLIVNTILKTLNINDCQNWLSQKIPDCVIPSK